MATGGEDLSAELKNLFESEAPLLRYERVETRSLDVLLQIVVFGSSIGAFGGLWKVVRELIRRHSGASVELSYESKDGTTVKVNYSNLTDAEAERMIREHPIESGPVHVDVSA